MWKELYRNIGFLAECAKCEGETIRDDMVIKNKSYWNMVNPGERGNVLEA